MSTYISQRIPTTEANSVNLHRQSSVDYMKKQAKICIFKKLNESEINNLPGEKLKAMVIKMFNELGRRIYEHRENFNKEMKK